MDVHVDNTWVDVHVDNTWVDVHVDNTWVDNPYPLDPARGQPLFFWGVNSWILMSGRVATIAPTKNITRSGHLKTLQDLVT